MSIEGRTMTTIRCRARRHVLARVVARPSDGHRVMVVPRWAVIDGYRVSNKHAGGLIDLDDEGDPTRLDARHVACACGTDFHLFPSVVMPSTRMEVRDGVRHRVEGATVPPASVILLDPEPARR